MKNKEKKLSVYTVFSIVFAVIGIICFICNAIYAFGYIQSYVSAGYPATDLIFSTIYQVMVPLATFGGISLVLLAFNTVIERLPYNKCEADIIQSSGEPISDEIAETNDAAETTETQEM